MFRLGVITDEIDADPERALRVAGQLGLRDVELNGAWGRNIVEASGPEIERIERAVQQGGFRVCALSTPAFKSLLLDDVESSPMAHPEAPAHMEWIARGCELAQRFRAPYVRIFSFRRSGMVGLGNPSPRLPDGGPLPGEVLAKIAAGLLPAADLAEAAGVTLVVENVRSCWGNSCRNTARILEAADHPRLRAVWDPGNDYVSGGDPFPNGYGAIRPWIAHVHVKNASLVDPETGRTRWERIGGGDLDYRPMLARLAADGYDGTVVLETHWRGDGLTAEESTRRSLADLQDCLSG